MLDPQHGHIGPAPRAALGHFAEGMVVDPQETDRAGGLTGGGFYQGALGPQAREGKTIPTAGLLDERGIPQGLENAGRAAAHIV